jgi:metal-responsive CopG/Arc/MetJ family transcriptional regulator
MISITLPLELLGRLDRVDKNRSALLERAALDYFARIENEKRDRRDLEIINRNTGRLNREAMDTLDYQMSTKARRRQRPSPRASRR